MNTLTHIAIIMDGNRRWARAHDLPISEGHRKAVFGTLEPLIDHAIERNIRYLTFWAFSTENWKRSKREVTTLMTIFRRMIRMRWQKLHEKGVRIRVIGDFSKFPEDIVTSIEEVVEQTKDNAKITVVFAINYGGRDEMVRAMNKLIHERVSLGTRNPLRPRSQLRSASEASQDLISENDFSRFLDTNGIPDPDLIVRTGGEKRLSGFLLWQSNYSELMFPSWYFPEFTPEKLDDVIEEFEKRQRRFGA